MKRLAIVVIAIALSLFGMQSEASFAATKPSGKCSTLNAKIIYADVTYKCVRVKGKLKWDTGSVKAGTPCTKLKRTFIFGTKKFTCVKSGSKLVWNKGVNIPPVPVVATPCPLPPITPIGTSAGTNVTLRMTAPTMLCLNGVPTNFMDDTQRSVSDNWSQYYGPRLRVFNRYFEIGSTMPITWHVTDSFTNMALPNKHVWLMINKNYGGVQIARFTYVANGTTHTVEASTSETGETQVEGVTDSSGDVTFTLVNINSSDEAETRPVSLLEHQVDGSGSFLSNITLTTHLPETVETKDFLWAHFTQPDSQLLWADEFNATSNSDPSAQDWATEEGGDGWGNGEQQYYRAANTKQDGAGNLVIRTLDSNASGLNCWYGTCHWTSGKIITRGKLEFKYGVMEARIKVPAGGGTWPAFWMLGARFPGQSWPGCGEIDIMEAAGNSPFTNWGTGHGPQNDGVSHTALGGTTTWPTQLSAGYHTYSVAWLPDRIQWRLDGIVFFTANRSEWNGIWPFNDNFYLILNLAMGGFFGGGIDANLHSAQMNVDWVRYYSLAGNGHLTRH